MTSQAMVSSAIMTAAAKSSAASLISRRRTHALASFTPPPRPAANGVVNGAALHSSQTFAAKESLPMDMEDKGEVYRIKQRAKYLKRKAKKDAAKAAATPNLLMT